MSFWVVVQRTYDGIEMNYYFLFKKNAENFIERMKYSDYEFLMFEVQTEDDL